MFPLSKTEISSDWSFVLYQMGGEISNAFVCFAITQLSSILIGIVKLKVCKEHLNDMRIVIV